MSCLCRNSRELRYQAAHNREVLLGALVRTKELLAQFCMIVSFKLWKAVNNKQ